MTLKKHSDNAVAFTFKRDFETMDHAQTISCAILGYMVGTYEQPTAKTTISKDKANNTFTLVVEYVSDSNLSEPFNRVCDSFEGYSEAQVMKRLGCLSAFKNLKKVDIKCPNCWKMSE